MRIVNRKKFVRTVSILIIILGALIIFSQNAYSKVEVDYKESYIYEGDTLWNIAKKQISENSYFSNKDIRDVINELKLINDLADSNLREGERIKIPIYR